jgi:hypothetical protein
MKYLKVVLEPFKIKGDIDDMETLQQDILEKVQALVESETLSWSIEEDEEDEDFE